MLVFRYVAPPTNLLATWKTSSSSRAILASGWVEKRKKRGSSWKSDEGVKLMKPCPSWFLTVGSLPQISYVNTCRERNDARSAPNTSGRSSQLHTHARVRVRVRVEICGDTAGDVSSINVFLVEQFPAYKSLKPRQVAGARLLTVWT